jgi:hypothetical protein
VAVQVTEGDGYCLGRVLINAQIAAPPFRGLHGNTLAIAMFFFFFWRRRDCSGAGR